MTALRISLLLLFFLTACRNDKEKEMSMRVPGAEFQVLAKRTAISKVKTPQEIAPYDDALTWHEYEVVKILYGKIKSKKIRVAHWTVIAAKTVPVSEQIGEVVNISLKSYNKIKNHDDIAMSDDLDFSEELPQFLDITQVIDTSVPPEILRYDYHGNSSEQMQLYWMLREQLQLVVMGHSHAAKGIDASLFSQPENLTTPTALNMAIPASNMELQCLILREYVEPLPKIKNVIWVVSPRSFNANFTSTRKESEFMGSAGYKYDLSHKAELWPVPPTDKLVTLEDLKNNIPLRTSTPWGWENRNHSILPKGDEKALHAYLKKEMSKMNFSWDEPDFNLLKSTIEALTAKNINVYLLFIPIHPYVIECAATDPDGTTKAGYRETIRRLEEFDLAIPRLHFRDFNNEGHHDFVPDDFYDADHVYGKGAVKLTEKVIEWMSETESKPQAVPISK